MNWYQKIKNPNSHIIFFYYLSMQPSVKNEGLFLLGFILFIILFFGNLNFKQKKLVVLVSVFLILLDL